MLATLRVKNVEVRQRCQQSRTRLNIGKLKDAATREKFSIQLRDRFDVLSRTIDKKDAESSLDRVAIPYGQISEQHLGVAGRDRVQRIKFSNDEWQKQG